MLPDLKCSQHGNPEKLLPIFYINHISLTPLLMKVTENDMLCLVDISLEAYSRDFGPKELLIIPWRYPEISSFTQWDVQNRECRLIVEKSESKFCEILSFSLLSCLPVSHVIPQIYFVRQF